MARSDRKNTILALLQDGPITGYSIAARVDAPDASVRRLIGTLRAEGHVITLVDGLYRLQVPVAPTTQTDLTGAQQAGA